MHAYACTYTCSHMHMLILHGLLHSLHGLVPSSMDSTDCGPIRPVDQYKSRGTSISTLCSHILCRHVWRLIYVDMCGHSYMWLHRVKVKVLVAVLTLHIQNVHDLKFHFIKFSLKSDDGVKSYSRFAPTLCNFRYCFLPFMAITNQLKKNFLARISILIEDFPRYRPFPGDWR